MTQLATRPARHVARVQSAAVFARELEFDSLPDDVVRTALLCLTDLIGVAAAGARTPAAAIVNAYASTQMCGARSGPLNRAASVLLPHPLVPTTTTRERSGDASFSLRSRRRNDRSPVR